MNNKKPPFPTKNILLLLGALFFAFLLCEIIVRSIPRFIYAYPKVPHGRILLGRPNTSYWTNKERLNKVILNNLGFHDKDRALQNNKYRFLFLGDSFLDGIQVPISDLYTSQLNDRFENERIEAEVINAGVLGSNTAYEYLLWKDYLENHIEVDHIVLVITMKNDLELNYRPLTKLLGEPTERWQHFIALDGTPIPADFEFSPLQKLIRFAGRYSAAVNFIYYRLYELKYMVARATEKSQRKQERQKPGYKEGREEQLKIAWQGAREATLRLIDRWQRELKESGIEFSVIIQRARKGQSEVLAKARQPFINDLKKMLRDQDRRFLVLRINKYETKEIFFLVDQGRKDGHFNSKGHKLVSELIYPWLKKQVKSD